MLAADAEQVSVDCEALSRYATVAGPAWLVCSATGWADVLKVSRRCQATGFGLLRFDQGARPVGYRSVEIWRGSA
jgi:hypothetical protein